MTDKVIIDNKDIKVEKIYLGDVLLSTEVTPKIPVQEQNEAFHKKYAKWL